MIVEIVRQARSRDLYFILFLAVSMMIFALPLWSLFRFSSDNGTFSYIPIVPLVSAYLLFQQRKEIFSGVAGTRLPGVALVFIAVVIYIVGSRKGFAWTSVDHFSLMAVSAVACFAGGISFFYGSTVLSVALFPLMFLLFMAPVPSVILDNVIRGLQYGSAELSFAFLQLIGIPVFREGYAFHIPGLTVEVAPQCSGIRSSISLFLVSLLAGHLFLKSGWRKAALSIMVVPITIVKNGIRIVALTLLGAYVDRSFLSGILHTSGGIPFFLAALVLLSGVLWVLRRSEEKETEE